MDITALFNLSYGLYIVGTKDGTRNVGCVVNSAFQISSTPSTIALSINKDNYTTDCILKEGGYTLSILSENARKELIGAFGFSSSRDKDKYERIKMGTTDSGLPYINEGVCSYLELKVLKATECFTHIVIFAEIVDAKNLSKEPPMTYSYYHKVVKGSAPKNAPTYVSPEKLAEATGSSEPKYVCSVCNYEFPGTPEEFENLPPDYVCPVCKQPKSKFVKTQ